MKWSSQSSTHAAAAQGVNGGLPARRVVLLGASNLTRGIGTVVETCCRLWGRPLDILAAHGHGRSYGLRKAILFRELPGIIESGLWEALERRPPAPTAALLTDIGNDLLYEVPVPEIVSWVEWCLDRIQKTQARVVMTRLPLANLESLTPRRFFLLRNLLFPGCPLSLATVTERAHDLDRRLVALAGQRGLSLVGHRVEWYGLDPIHIKVRHWSRAYGEIMSPWLEEGLSPGLAQGSLWRWIYLRLLAPDRRWLLGREQRQVQPAGILADGTAVSFY
jgi:hypothetical protein